MPRRPAATSRSSSIPGTVLIRGATTDDNDVMSAPDPSVIAVMAGNLFRATRFRLAFGRRPGGREVTGGDLLER